MTPLARLRAARKRRARSAFLDSVRGHIPVVGFEHDAGIFVVPADDRTVLRKVFVGGGRSDFVVLDRAVRILRERGFSTTGTFIDVGANLGTTTVAAVRLHGFARAVACEPDSANARFLRATIAVNGLESAVTVVEAAIANTTGQMPFLSRAPKTAGWKSGSGGLQLSGTHTVTVTTLDALSAAGVYTPEEVDLVWLDVQGAEGLVLAGAELLLSLRVPVVTAVRPRRLVTLDGLEAFTSAIAAHFSTFVDLRAPNLKPEWSPTLLPVGEFDTIMRLPKSTDVLLLP